MIVTRILTLILPILSLTLLSSLTTGKACAEPAVIYDGFGAQSSFDTATAAAFGSSLSGGGPSDIDLAVPFTIPRAQEYHLHAIDLAITASSGSSEVEVRILGNAPGLSPPGLPVESLVHERVTLRVPMLDDQGGTPDRPSITHLDLSQGPALRAGAQYWLALSASKLDTDSTLTWWSASHMANGLPAFIATRSNLGPWRLAEAPGRGLAARIVVTPVPSRTATTYGFKKIADTLGHFRAFPQPGLVVLSNTGTVVFRAELDTGSEGIFSSTGGPVTTVAETGHALKEFGRLDSFPSLNASGVVVWRGTLRDGAEGIFKRKGSSLTSVVDAQGPFHSFGHPTVNSSGAVAFVAGLDGQGGGVFMAKDGAIGALAHTDGPFDGFFGRPSMNDKGTVAFGARLDSGETGIYAWRKGSVRTAIADTTGPFSALRGLSINDRGTIAFRACLKEGLSDCPLTAGGGQGLFAGNGGPLVKIADTSGPFDALGDPTLNNAGQAAFIARLDSGHHGIYTGPDAERDKVLVTGDSLLGSEVTDLGFVHGLGFNDAGQIAFFARLQDGTEGIYLATPHTRPQ